MHTIEEGVAEDSNHHIMVEISCMIFISREEAGDVEMYQKNSRLPMKCKKLGRTTEEEDHITAGEIKLGETEAQVNIGKNFNSITAT